MREKEKKSFEKRKIPSQYKANKTKQNRKSFYTEYVYLISRAFRYIFGRF